MSVTGKSVKWSTSTTQSGPDTITKIVVEETFKYSDGRTETKTREMTVNGPPPSKEQIKAFVDSGVEEDLQKLSISSQSDKKDSEASAKPQKDVPPTEYAKQAVDAHNALRRKHGVENLVVSQELCDQAQKWADYLISNNKFEHSTNKDRPNIGENIACTMGSSKDLDYKASDVTQSWYDEIKVYKPYYGKEPPPFGSVPAYGHFTQVVWKGTKELGIGKAKGNGKVVVVANYRPAGNMIGSYAKNVFPLK